MARTVLMIGTRKGLWIATSDGPPGSRGRCDGPDELRSEVHAVALDTATTAGRDRPRLFMASKHWHWGPQVLLSDDLGATWEKGPDGAIKFPEDTGRTLESVWSIAPSPCDPDVVWAGTRAVRAVPVDRRRRDLHDGPLAVGPPAPRAVGRRLRRPGHPHRAAAPHRPAAGDRRDVDRRRLPHLRRRRHLGAGQPGHPGGLPARGRAVPRVRPVRAQGRPRPGEPGPALPAEPRRRLPQRRRRRTRGRRSPTGCPATSASRSWPTRASPAPCGSSRSRAPTAASRSSGTLQRLALPGRRRDLGGAARPGCPTASSPA